MELAQKYKDHLPQMKDHVKAWHEYWANNIKRFNEGKKFVYYSTLNEDEKIVLDDIGQPKIQCNLLEAFLSKLCGEFSKQEPNIVVGSEQHTQDVAEKVRVVEAHFRHQEHEARLKGTPDEIYKDLGGGGYSAVKIYTEYKNEMSFDQDIKWKRCFDPTLCGWDVLAQETDKSDGSFCFELFPKTKEEFERMYPDADLSKISFGGNTGGFSWSYFNSKEKILLICDYYEKKKKDVKIVRLANDEVMTQKKYDAYIEEWEASGIIEQPPIVVESRWSTEETICRYRFIENQVLEYEETDYPGLPIVFVDCNSVMVHESSESAITQVIRPYGYNAVGTQKVINVALQSIANEMQNSIQHKFMIAKEAIPEEYLAAYTDPQVPRVVIYNAFLNTEGTTPGQVALPPPREVQRPPMPQEFMQMLTTGFQLLQQILGSFQPDLNNKDISGKAVIESATQSNNAAMPMIIGYMRAMNRIAQMYVDMIPKYYVTPRTLPVMMPDGKKGYVSINQDGGMKLSYDKGLMNIKVEAGVNSEIQKARAIQLLAQVGQAFPIFAQFIGSKGLNVIVDNLDLRSIDQLKDLATQFEAEIKQQQQQAQQMQQQQMQMQQQAQQNDPRMITAKLSAQKMQLDAQQNQIKNQLAAAQLGIDKERNDTERMKVLSDLKQSNDDVEIAKTEQQTRVAEKQVELAMKAADLSHRHVKEHHELILKHDEHRMKGEAHDKAMNEEQDIE